MGVGDDRGDFSAGNSDEASGEVPVGDFEEYSDEDADGSLSGDIRTLICVDEPLLLRVMFELGNTTGITEGITMADDVTRVQLVVGLVID